MSIAQQIARIKDNIDSAYDGLADLNAEAPHNRVSGNLRNAIDSLPRLSDKMDSMKYASTAEAVQAMDNGQLFKYRGDIGVTDSESSGNCILLAKKTDLAALATKAELAALSQVEMPVFANDISECVDTDKLYVLPNGYIYAYMRTAQLVPAYTNLVPTSVTSDGITIYNGTGYKDGAYVSGLSDGVDADFSACGYIPYSVPAAGLPQEIYVKGALWDGNSHTRISFFASDFSYLNAVSCSSSGGLKNLFQVSVLGDNYFKFVPIASGSSSALYAAAPNVAYVRFSFRCTGSDMIISTSPIENSTQYITQWDNTGLAFVPADYESRIIALENDDTDSKARIAALENSSSRAAGSSVPDYVVTESERVSKAVLSHQNPDTITFLAISDAHYKEDSVNVKNSVIHAGMGMELVRSRVHIDFGAVLGDNGWQSSAETLGDGIDQIRATNRLIDGAFRGIPNLRTPGNHCSQIGSYYTNGDYHLNADLYPLYGAYNTGAVFDGNNRRRGYCLRDFDDRKLRVITLNTSDLEAQTPADLEAVDMSSAQLSWLVSALDVSGKNSPSDWQILILAHAPLDWNERVIPAAAVLKAYRDGTAGSVTKNGVVISYDFSAMTRGSIIAQIHGHVHGYKADNLRCLNSGGTATASTGIKRIAVPNACYSRNNQYGNGEYEYMDIDFGDDTTYNKTAGTANDTAFCVFTIDLASRTVYADHYGAGFDRTVQY